MKRHTYFIAGTDTDVGKTYIACALLQAAKALDLTTLGLKPISAGCDTTEHGLRNDDAMQLMASSTVKLPYEQVNPYAFEPPIAPHIAAQEEKRSVSISQMQGLVSGALMAGAQFSLVEGAGGWRVPVNNREFLSRLPQLLDMPVILVVGVKLGCLNHARLTAEAIKADGLKIAGWVANCIDPNTARLEENLTALQGLLGAPCLGRVPLSKYDPSVAKKHLNLSKLLG